MTLSPKSITNLRRLLLGLACLATLLALFVVEENWRGDRAWAAFQRADRASRPAQPVLPVPDDRNLFKAPAVARVLTLHPGETNAFLASTGLGRLPVLYRATDDTLSFADIRRMLKATKLHTGPDSPEPAQDLLAAMQPMHPLLDEFRQAALDRPEAGFDPAPNPLERPSSSSAPMERLLKALTLRARAELAVGDTEGAYADTYAIARISSGLYASRPISMINFFNGMGGYYSLMAAVTDGIRRHAWNEWQLAELQRLLSGLDALASLNEYLIEQRDMMCWLLDLSAPPHGEKPRPFWLFRGWIQQNKLVLARHYEHDLLPVVGGTPLRVLPERMAHFSQVVAKLQSSHSPYDWASQSILPSMEKSMFRAFVRHAMHHRMIATLCALERHRLARGHYPKSLEALVPAYLPEMPQDIFDGQPLRLETLPDGSQRLFSTGLDSRDNSDDIIVPLPTLP